MMFVIQLVSMKTVVIVQITIVFMKIVFIFKINLIRRSEEKKLL